MGANAVGLGDLVEGHRQPLGQVVVHLTAHLVLVVLGTKLRSGKVVVGRLFERWYLARSLAPRNGTGRVLSDEQRSLGARVRWACLGVGAQLHARRFTVHVLLVVEGLLRFAREQAESFDLDVPEFRVRRGVFADGVSELQSFSRHLRCPILQ